MKIVAVGSDDECRDELNHMVKNSDGRGLIRRNAELSKHCHGAQFKSADMPRTGRNSNGDIDARYDHTRFKKADGLVNSERKNHDKTSLNAPAYKR